MTAQSVHRTPTRNKAPAPPPPTHPVASMFIQIVTHPFVLRFGGICKTASGSEEHGRSKLHSANPASGFKSLYMSSMTSATSPWARRKVCVWSWGPKLQGYDACRFRRFDAYRVFRKRRPSPGNSTLTDDGGNSGLNLEQTPA